MLRNLATLLVLAGLATPAAAQSLSILVTEGDVVPGVGQVTRVDGVAIADGGATLIEVDTDNADSDADTVVLRDGTLFLREGDAVAAPAGATIGSFDGTSIRPGGRSVFNLFLDGTTGTSDNSGLYVDDDLVLQKGSLSFATGFTPGTPYIGFFDVEWATDSRLLCVASIDDANIASTVDRALMWIDVDGSGNLLNEEVIVKEGDVLPGQTEPIADFETGAEESAASFAGRVLYTVDLAGDTSVDRAVYLDTTLLMQEGSPSPVPGRNWGSLASPEVDLNEAGDWVVKANLDTTDTSNDQVIVRNGAIFRREGDTVPDIAGFTLTDFGGSVGVWLTESGDVLWFGDWNDPDTSRDEGLFLNDTLLLQEGVTQIGGQTIVDLSDITEQVAVSPDGSRILIEGEIAGPGSDLDVVIQIDLGLGENYCPNPVNSTGFPTLISLSGSDLVAANDLTLRARDMPLQTFGFFLASRLQGIITSPGVPGVLCLDSPIGRYVGPGQIQNSGTTGMIALTVDLSMTPQPTGFVSVAPGETWYFQTWHRDSDQFGQATSRFSDAICLTFR
ncbi:MAG: hypothetical protein AAGI22_18650 [Planctomycetota bacterium]